MSTKRSLLTSCLALFLCFAMLLGTTFAWFTDTVTSSGNKIKSGSLKLDLKVLTEVIEDNSSTHNEWVSIKNEQSPLFTYENWEPGYTDVTILKVENLGTLALKWEARFASEQPLSALAEVIDVYVKPGVEEEYPDERADLKNEGWNNVGNLKQFVNTLSETTYGYLDGILTVGGTTSATLGIALKMREDAGNEYQDLTLGEFDIRIVATQAMKEEDSFGNDYDKDAQWPQFSGSADASAPVNTDSTGKVTEETTVTSEDGRISATLPEGVMLTPGTTTADLTVTEKEESEANLLIAPGEEMTPFDVHIEGVAEGNTKPIAVTVKALLPVGLNAGNYALRHVEDGMPQEMTLLAEGATPAHNTYTYDPATGDVTLYMASFSEVAVTAYSDNKWNGNFDYSWYTDAASYKIANADQLAAFGAIVGGMKVVTGMKNGVYTYSDEVIQDSFAGKTVTLIADINIGDSKEYCTDPSENGIVFYPIGYYNTDETYERTSKAIESYFNPFMGTFDGNGHTISNFYQNTWEMKGDNSEYALSLQYYRDGMGLFGKVYGGKVMNLTVDNFSSDGEFTTTGVIAAYADCGAIFENIAITNCNPRVYNIGNGGIVGAVGWYAKETVDKKVTFKNITVDKTNTISALWGSWDVACGGIVGQYYPTSGQTSAGTPKNAGMHFDNCRVSAVMDVYNDVCANYQYYAYRYTGLLVGSVRENETIDGHVYPKMEGITANDTIVHFGDWNDYYYCEIVANSLASYTHDHQMSRLTQVQSIDATNLKGVDLNGKEFDIPKSGWAHYVVVKEYNTTTGKYTHGDGARGEYATCYHFNNGKEHNHADSGEETVNGQTVLKEDKQVIYREFNNLVTGYGWGVTSKGVNDLDGVFNLESKLATEGESIVKFEPNPNAPTNVFSNHKYNISEFFTIKGGLSVPVILGTVTVSAMNLDTNDQVIVKVHLGDGKNEQEIWNNTKIEFINTGTSVALTIQDYYYCTPTTSEGKYTLNVAGQFLLHNNTFSQKDDFSNEWSETTETGSFTTAGKTTYYYIDKFASNTNTRFSKYFYVETDITIHGTTNGDQWAKIGLMSGNHYKDIGQTESQYRMTTFYLAVNRAKYNEATKKWDILNANQDWNQFGVTEIYNKYGWGWNLANDTIYSDSGAYEMPKANYKAPNDKNGDGMINFDETFKIGLLRDGTNYHFFVNGIYAYTYQIDSNSELYAGRNIETDVGLFQINCQATYSNYKVIRSGSSLIGTANIPAVPNQLKPIVYDQSDLNPDWCYHSFTKFEAKDPTCGEDGNIAYNYCVKCNKNYAPNAIAIGNANDYTLKSQALTGDVVVKATGAHSWIDNCCKNCGIYKITVNHLNMDGSEFKAQETVVREAVNGIVTYEVDKTALENVVPSRDFVKVNVADNSSVDIITIYYSEVDSWDGADKSEGLAGEGTAEDPFLIQSAADFAYFASVINAVEGEAGVNNTVESFKGQYIEMTKSIDLGGHELYVGKHIAWNNYQGFFGTFNGNGYVISGINIDNTNDGISAALFGCVNGGTIKNLVIKGSVTGKQGVAGLVAYTRGNATIENVTSYVTLTQTGTGENTGMVGGIIANEEGELGYPENTIIGCVNYGDITAESYIVGGVVGSGGANIKGCVNWGNVITKNGNVGGITAETKAVGTIEDCINYGMVKTTGTYSEYYVGGIVGRMRKNSITNCINYGEVYGPIAAGIIGKTDPTGLNPAIDGCVNYGIICGTITGQIIPSNVTANVTNCTSHGLVHLYKNAPVVSGNGTTITYTCSICKATKVENNVPVWDGSASDSLATLTDVTPENPAGSVNNPYLISSGADLQYLDNQVTASNTNTYSGKYFKMTNSINLNGKSITIGKASGWGGAVFNGIFDGNGYSIVNLKISEETQTHTTPEGLFHILYSGTIKNLTVHGSASAKGSVGGIVGQNHRGTLENCVSYVNVTSTEGNAGGLAGLFNYFKKESDKPEIGGIDAYIINCVNYGTVSGATNAGGIAGDASGIITDCTNYGDVTGKTTAGQIYGCTDGTLTLADGTPSITVTECVENGTAIVVK